MKIFFIIIVILSIIACNNDEKKNEVTIFQWGTSFIETGKDASFDKEGNLYVVYNESESYEKGKLIVTKFSTDGEIIWTKKYENNNNFHPNNIEIENSDIYISSYSVTIRENMDSLIKSHILKIDSSGNQTWLKDIFIDEDSFNQLVDFKIKDGELYIVGNSYEDMASDNQNIFLLILSSSGNIISKTFFGTDKDDVATSMTFDNNKSNLYILGISQGAFDEDINLGNGDALLLKIDTNNNNNLLWGKTWGTSKTDFTMGLLYHDGIFVVGNTKGMIETDKQKGESDIFVTKLNDGGFIQWSKQFGTIKDEKATNIILKDENLFILGDTNGDFEGKSNGEIDIFLLELDLDGTKISLEQFGTDKDDESFKIIINQEKIYILGNTLGEFSETAGNKDLFKIEIK